AQMPAAGLASPPARPATRRIATVVSAVPDATSASSSVSRFAAPPVPMTRRDPTAVPATTSGSAPAGSVAAGRDAGERSVVTVSSSAALDGGHDLDAVTGSADGAGPRAGRPAADAPAAAAPLRRAARAVRGPSGGAERHGR